MILVYIGAAVAALVAFLVVAVMRAYMEMKSMRKAERRFEEALRREGFHADREIKYRACALYVDGGQKRWSIKADNREAAKVYRFADLLGFRVQDGAKICVEGKAGGILKGRLIRDYHGADEKEGTVCEGLRIHLIVKDGIERILSCVLIRKQTQRNLVSYTEPAAKAQEMIDALVDILQIRRDPEAEAVESAIEAAEKETPPSAPKENAEESGREIKAKMEQLENLREHGLISEDEYRGKKAELLERL